MKNSTVAAMFAAALLLAACEEGVTPPKEAATRTVSHPAVAATGPSKIISTDSPEPPAGVPEGYPKYSSIDVRADAGWMSPTMAYGGGILEYFGNNATLDVDLSVRNAQGTVVASNVLHATESWVFPGSHTINRSTTVAVSQTCGLVLQVTAHGAVWMSFFTTTQQVLSWGKQTESDSRSAYQQACPVSGSTGGTGTTTTYPAVYPYTYQITSFVPAHWECTYYDAGSGYQKQSCVYYPAVGSVTDRAPTSAGALASRNASSPGALLASNAPAIPSVYVIVSDNVPANAIAVIERRKKGPFKNVLLVPSKDLRPAVFVAAMEALYQSRASRGESPNKDLRIELRGNVQDQEIPSALRDYASSFTSLIANAKPAFADSYGTTQIVEIRMRGNR